MRSTLRAQRFNALAEANRIRLARAQILQAMEREDPAASCRRAAELLADPPEVLASLSVQGLLERVRRIGPDSTGRILDLMAERLDSRRRVSPLSELRALTPRQRAALVHVLRARADRSERRPAGVSAEAPR